MAKRDRTQALLGRHSGRCALWRECRYAFCRSDRAVSGVAHMNSDEDCADSVTCLYATRFFRKRPQITPALLRVVSGALHSPNSALKCLYIWGVHEKPLPDSDDDATIAHLQALLERIGSLLRVNLTMQIVIADSHGQLNEARSELSDQYA